MNKHAVSACALLLITFLSGCSGATGSASGVSPSALSTTTPTPTPTPTKTVTPTVSPSASAVKTSGSYKADMAALGVVPDDDKSFADFMKSQICTKTGSSLGVGVRSVGGNPTGGGVEGVRLTVAYFCPQKSKEVESYLDYFK